MKYQLPNNQSEILPNLLNLTSAYDIALSEFEGFLKAEIICTENITTQTRFSVEYILHIHKTALQHLYPFAGKYRNVNMSKGNFTFPAARFLPEIMNNFEKEILLKLPNDYSDKNLLIRDIAVVHSELLFIHPFREGNGRTARILANLMMKKAGYTMLEFEKIAEKEFEWYVRAVQNAAAQDYSEMIKLIGYVFPE